MSIRDLSDYFEKKLNWNYEQFEISVGAWANYLIMQKLKEKINQKDSKMMETFSIHFIIIKIFFYYCSTFKNIKTFSENEMKCLAILADFELPGIEVDMKMVSSMTDTILKLRNKLEANAYKLAGQRFTISSPAAVAKVSTYTLIYM